MTETDRTLMTTTTAAPLSRTRRALSDKELGAEATARFGEDPLNWAFECPDCGDIATGAEFPAGKRSRVGAECIGLHVEGRGCHHRAADSDPQGPWLVALEDGTVAPSFPLAARSPQAPMTARLMDHADVARGEVGKCSKCGAGVSVFGHDGLPAGYVTDAGLRCGWCCDSGGEPEPSHARQSAPQDPGVTPGPEGAEDAPAAPYVSARALRVERGSDPMRISRPDGEFRFDVNRWTYRVALTPDHSVLGYQDIDDGGLCVIFADAAVLLFGAFMPLPEQSATVLEHIAKHELPITAEDVATAERLIREAVAADDARADPRPFVHDA
jgi:hypothetical protein